MAAFGWSVGDIIKAVEITVAVCKAFKETGGAATKYKQACDFLDGFKATLKHLHEYVQDSSEDAYAQDVRDQLEKMDRPWKAFQAFVDKYEKSLSEDSKRGIFHRAPRTVQWTLNDLSGEVEKLEDAISRPLLVVGSLLSLQILNAIKKGPTELLSPAQCGQLIEAIHLAGIPAELSHRMETLQLAASLSEEEHYEQAFKIVELQDLFSKTEANFLRVMEQQGELYRQQLTDMSDKLEQSIEQTPSEAKSSKINDVLARHALIDSICNAISERIGSIQKPEDVPLDSRGTRDSKSPRFAETAGLIATMLFTTMTSSFTAAIIVGRSLSEKSVVPPETFDIWMQQWRQQAECRYECVFSSFNCKHMLRTEEDWETHVLKHFKNARHPCISGESGEEHLCKALTKLMGHVASRLRAGNEISGPDVQSIFFHFAAYRSTTHDDSPRLQHHTLAGRKESSDEHDRQIKRLLKISDQEQPTALEASSPRDPWEGCLFSTWWRCCCCKREIKTAYESFRCPDCEHARCDTCHEWR